MERLYGRPIISQADMQKRIRELGKQIAEDYEGKKPVMVGVLKGAFAFFSDLVRGIHLPVLVDFIVVSSYGSGAKPSGQVKIVSDLTVDVKGCDVLLVEDIVDSGLTLTYLKGKLKRKNPRSIKVCTLLNKPERRIKPVKLDYVGFDISNKYVVGYGLDYQGKYRNLPYIAVLDQVSEDHA